MTTLFPMFVKLDGRECLVAGGGEIAEGKARSLLASGARVVLVAPEVTEAIASWSREGRMQWHAREFHPADLDGVFLVIAATGVPAVNEAIFHEAQKRGVLCNAVDEPERCDFYYPALVRRGPLQIAISTGGLSPALAHRLRVELEKQFGPEYEAWVQELGARRQVLFKTEGNSGRRSRMLHASASRSSFQKFLRRRRRLL